MDKITKYYAEKIYKYGDKPIIQEVMYKNPVLLDDENIAAVRFFDQKFIKDGNMKIPSQRDNFTNWICYGTRWKIEDAIEKWSDDSTIQKNLNNFLEYGYSDVCCTKDGLFIPLEDGDMTYPEFISVKPFLRCEGGIFLGSVYKTKMPMNEIIGKSVSCIDTNGNSVLNDTLTDIISFPQGVIFYFNGDVRLRISNYSPISAIIDDDGNTLYQSTIPRLRLMYSVDPHLIVRDVYGYKEKWLNHINSACLEESVGVKEYHNEVATLMMLKMNQFNNPSNEEIEKIENDVFKKMNMNSTKNSDVMAVDDYIRTFYKQSNRYNEYTNQKGNQRIYRRP